MRKICVVTATRAEYGLLAPVIRELRNYENDNFKVELIVTGTHLSPQYGMTIKEINLNGQRIDRRIEIPVDSATAVDISYNQAETLLKFTELFVAEHYDGVVVLGDRYEILMVAIAAGNTLTPIFHINGGDTTEGAIDEWIRHSVTKISYLHFPTNEESRRRIIQLGEEPKRVFNVGSVSIDNILAMSTMTKKEALMSVGMDLCDYVLCTYHPVTMEKENAVRDIEEFLAAIQVFPDLQFIVTKSNADQGGVDINAILDTTNINNLHVFSSLGVKRYLSLMKYAEFVLGNSSSGIMEAPALHVPTVNIGDRQRGRMQSDSIINCGSMAEDIIYAIKLAMTREYKEISKRVISPYGNGGAAQLIAKKIMETLSGEIDLKKKFYTLSRRYE